jgi:hypothetical protein
LFFFLFFFATLTSYCAYFVEIIKKEFLLCEKETEKSRNEQSFVEGTFSLQTCKSSNAFVALLQRVIFYIFISEYIYVYLCTVCLMIDAEHILCESVNSVKQVGSKLKILRFYCCSNSIDLINLIEGLFYKLKLKMETCVPI